MRVNSRVFTERTDMLDGIRIPNCSPKELRETAEKLMNMIIRPGYSVGDYNSVTELDKKITVDYWAEYDGLMMTDFFYPSPDESLREFKNWYKKATEPEIISRARRWLLEHNFVFLKPEVQQRAMEASRNFRQAVKG